MKKNKERYISKKGWRNFLYAKHRRDLKKRIAIGKLIHQENINRNNKRLGRINLPKKKKLHFTHKFPIGNKPQLPPTLLFLKRTNNVFSEKKYFSQNNGRMVLPEVFSLLDNYEESFTFLKRLLNLLVRGKISSITIDYLNCKRIDVDASLCMDIILAEFIQYTRICKSKGWNVLPNSITPINYMHHDIEKILFSIGTFANLAGVEKNYSDVSPLPVLINNNKLQPTKVWATSELHQTKIVDYIQNLLRERFDRELTVEAETELYKVIGEVMANAEEHGTMPYRYAIGYFKDDVDDKENHFGIFNFSIFNFGLTIYQKFKSSDCLNKDVVEQMSKLSEDYTRKGLIRAAEFEEETLWTLYALQEGVTTKDKPRGNGSIQYIQNFFKLKGDLSSDNISRMLVVSGNTRIVFDGTYQIIEKMSHDQNRKFKMITFNQSGDIHDKPDKEFVTFAPYYFPGTLISARILLKYQNTSSDEISNN